MGDGRWEKGEGQDRKKEGGRDCQSWWEGREGLVSD